MCVFVPYIHVRDNPFYAFFVKYSFKHIKVGFILMTHFSCRQSYNAKEQVILIILDNFC